MSSGSERETSREIRYRSPVGDLGLARSSCGGVRPSRRASCDLIRWVRPISPVLDSTSQMILSGGEIADRRTDVLRDGRVDLGDAASPGRRQPSAARPATGPDATAAAPSAAGAPAAGGTGEPVIDPGGLWDGGIEGDMGV
ncbi:hypothetical protein [Streptosporangium carneum]|uniref:Uncharacterized protein n=1 Tax=Streptosporangium carneum TaxID=47481 RepID=A0A9W6I6S6_9ACTN|nr:hypothetical protein [Streptosporangium carneum]GLK11990.1 hypothetical protein GCM10017600_53980 [Streptosporangium carneum]